MATAQSAAAAYLLGCSATAIIFYLLLERSRGHVALLETFVLALKTILYVVDSLW